MKQIIINKIDGNIIVTNDKYDRVYHENLTNDRYIDIDVDYKYLQWSDAEWVEAYYVDESDAVISLTDSMVSLIDTTVTNWEQDLGQQGNPTLAQAQDYKIGELTTAFTKEVKDISNAPFHEMMSWRKQEEEANAIKVDSSTPSPMIDELIYGRGLSESREGFAGLILRKAKEYEISYSKILAKYHVKLKAVEASTMPEEVGLVFWD